MLTCLAGIIFVTHLLIAWELLYAGRRLLNLSRIAPLSTPPFPSVSIIVAARNEEQQMEQALSSLLNLDYPQYEIIVVNDRSTDETGAILERMADKHPPLRTITVDHLPEGWLGKNHALWLGSHIAGGELLLFTDADIIMAPDTLRRAVGLLQFHQADHLAVSPAVTMPGFLLNLLGACFGFFFGLYTRPWRVADPRNRQHIGIGAFNLVRAGVYRQIGGHSRIRLRPDDDLKLGKIIKDWGFRQQFACGQHFIRVQWYNSVREMVVGLEKNLFAGSDYRIGKTLAGIGGSLILFVWPYAALLLTTGLTRLLSATSVLVLSLLLFTGALRFNTTRWQVIGFPLAALLLCGISLRTMVVNLVNGGIRWRGTFYPLSTLRKNRV